MLYDDLKEQLKTIEPDIQVIKEYWSKSGAQDEFNTLQAQANDENLWQNPQQAEILKAFQRVKTQQEQYSEIINGFASLEELIELFATDEAELAKIATEQHDLIKKTRRFKLELLLHESDDRNPCYLTINSGAGGTESQDWAEILLRMYLRFCERESFNAQLLDYQGGEGAGIKSATVYIKGKNAYGFLKAEHGIHRLVRISPFDANKRRHTSFAGVTVIPEFPESTITIDPTDLRVDTYRAGGAGGQHVNKTESAIRITHIPTGIVVQCQNERSQAQNKEVAMKMLMAKLVQKKREEEEAQTAKIERKKIEWGSQIRSYVLHPYKMVKDHRTDLESPQPDLVLDGDIMEFIEKYLIESTTA